jgi:hypothetical protein
MPTYVICSTDPSDYGRIDHIDLQPHFNALDATVAVTNVNTLANFQVLTEDDYITFDIGKFPSLSRYTLKGKDQQGMSWESITGVLNTIMRNDGQTMTAGISDLHRLMFSNVQIFSVIYMTYNFEVMLGFVGHQWNDNKGNYFPITSEPYDVWLSRKSSEVPYILPTGMRFHVPNPDDLGLNFQIFSCDSNKPNHLTIPVDVLPNTDKDGYACNYTLKYSLLDWHFDSEQWCSILEATGTVTTKKLTSDYSKDVNAGKVRYVSVRCELWVPYVSDAPRFTITTRLNLVIPYVPLASPSAYILVSKDFLFFNETARISCQTSNIVQDNVPDTWRIEVYNLDPVPWQLDKTTRMKFIGSVVNNGSQSEDSGHGCMVQAGMEAGPVSVVLYDKGRNRSWRKTITILNDMIPIPRFKVEAPSVGTGISTSQLYLMSNIGSDVFRSSIDRPRDLQNARVAAIINNSFSAGYPVLAGGEPAIQVATMDVSNLSFRLCDANFRPIRLLNPMALTLQVNPVDANPVADISSFKGKLPKDRPTARELQKAREEELQQQVQQAELAKLQKQQMESIMSKLTPDQQLQYLALPPDKQELFRMFNEEANVQLRMTAEQHQQQLQQLAQTAPERMNPIMRFIYQFLPQKKQEEVIAEQVQEEDGVIEHEKEVQAQQAQVATEDADVAAEKEKEKASDDALAAAVEADRLKKAQDEAQRLKLQDDLEAAYEGIH